MKQAQMGIIILGLGPGSADLLTREAWRVLDAADEVYVRTRSHPAVSGLPEGLTIHSFDDLFHSDQTPEEVYTQIVEQISALGRRPQGVLYAVPGDPMVAEATVPEILRRAQKEGLPVRVIDGLSFLEPVFAALGIDPFPQISLVDALEEATGHVPSFPPDKPALIAQIHSRQIVSDLKLILMEVYPGDHPIRLVHAAGTDQEIVEELPLSEADHSERIGSLTALYVPPLGPGSSLESFQEIIAHLRAPNGCPWDREQTHLTLRPNLVEEAYEALSAIDEGSSQEMCEEFGDLLLQIVLHAQIAAEEGEFTMADVIQGIYAKIVRRHPHVFGDVDLADADSVLQNWERLKEVERANSGKTEAGLLTGVASALPALVQAESYQQRVARVGFEWPDLQDVIAKVTRSFNQARMAEREDERAIDVGDFLFAVVNLARWYSVDAESALREANARYRRRVEYLEAAARKQGVSISDLSKEEMEKLWKAAKEEE